MVKKKKTIRRGASYRSPSPSAPATPAPPTPTTPAPTTPPGNPTLPMITPTSQSVDPLTLTTLGNDLPQWEQTLPPFSIPLALLTHPYPNGLGMQHTCQEWLEALGVSTMEDFVQVSQEHTLDTIPQFLPPTLAQPNQNDILIFLEFGTLCKTNQHTSTLTD